MFRLQVGHESLWLLAAEHFLAVHTLQISLAGDRLLAAFWAVSIVAAYTKPTVFSLKKPSVA